MLLSLPPLTIVIIGFSIIIAALVVWVILLELRLKKFLLGTGSINLDQSLSYIAAELKDTAQFRKELEEYLKTVETRVRRSAQGIHTVRFNPFKGTGSGSNQSFATALINEEGTGVVFSSLYSRDRVSIFAKPIVKYQSEFDLTKEELEAIATAKQAMYSRN